jgi:hypothetical protein
MLQDKDRCAAAPHAVPLRHRRVGLPAGDGHRGDKLRIRLPKVMYEVKTGGKRCL